MTAGRRLPWWSLLLVGVVLFSPAVRTGFLLDDYLHIAMVERTFPAERSAFDLYDFVDDGVRPALMERGLLPWWAHPKLTLRFLRPLSSALLWVDHTVFGRAPLPMHLHSLAWWVAAAVAARALFRRALSPRIVVLATAIFALASCHAMPIAWLANREALVSLTFGTLALAVHARWRETGRGRDAALAALLFALALLGGGEYAISFGGYVLAMELVDGKGRSLAKRALGLVPFIVPAGAYAIVRTQLGYGAIGSGFYADPLREPLVFLQQAPWRIVALLGEEWLTIDSRSWQSTSARVALGAIVVVSFVLVLVIARRAIALLDAPARTMASWLLLGSLFAIAPVLAVVPAPRLLGVSMIGVAGVVAIVLDYAWFSPAANEGRRGARELAQTVAITLGFAQLVHGPGASFLWSREFHADADRFAANANRLRAGVGDVAHAEIGVVRGTIGMFFAPFALDPRGRTPARWIVLADTGHILAIRRDARTLELIAPVGSGLYPVVTGSLLRSPEARLRAGDTVSVRGMTAKIVDASEAAGPRDVVFTFDRDLDDATAIVWINETRDDWTWSPLPVVGFGKPFDP